MHILDSLLAFSAYFFYWRGYGDYFFFLSILKLHRTTNGS